MSWGRFFFEIYIARGDRKGPAYDGELAFFSMSNRDDVKSHRDKVAKYLEQLDKALAENDPDDLDIVMNQ